MQRLDDAGIGTVTPFDADYPRRFIERLPTNAPPILHTAGRADLLNMHSLGAVGTRNPSPQGVVAARACGDVAAHHRWPLVSGGARGVDSCAMNAAVAANGTAIGVLADPLNRRISERPLQHAIESGQVLLVTPFSPSTPFSTGVAMGRNRLIYALAAVTVVVACAYHSGGTWTGAEAAIKRGHGPVAVWRGTGEGPGNIHLEQAGAVAVTNTDEIAAAAAAQADPPPISPNVGYQATLFSNADTAGLRP